MNDATKAMLVGILRHLLTIAGGSLAAHGLINSSGIETFVSLGLMIAGVGWSVWDKYGRDIVTAQLEVWKAKALAQKEAMKEAKVPEPSNTEIANKVPDPKVTAAVVAKVTASCLAFFLVMLLAAPAFAQPDRAAGRKPALTGNIVNDIRQRADSTDNVGGGIGGGKGLNDLLGALDAKLLPDLKYALALANKSNSKVTAPCYEAWIAIIETRQSAALDKDGNAIPEPDPHIVTTFEKMVELRNALQPDSDFMVKCSPVASMVKRDIVGFIGVVISGGAGLATLVPGL